MLKVVNHSKFDISVSYSDRKGALEVENNVEYYLDYPNVVRPDSEYTIMKLGNDNAWHDYIQKGLTKKLLIYIFDIDTLKKYNGRYSMNELRASRKYLKVFDFSEQDLINKNWKVDFYPN